MNSNAKILTAAVTLAILVLAIFSIRFLTAENKWLCRGGEWVKEGNPSAPRPEEVCGQTKERIIEGVISNISAFDNQVIEITSDNKRYYLTDNARTKIYNEKNEPVDITYLKPGFELRAAVSRQATDVLEALEIRVTKTPEIMVESPRPGQIVASPFLLEGRARGNWYFEASFPMRLLDDKGNELLVQPVQAKGDWMTADYVPFVQAIAYHIATATPVTLVLQNDNPSGKPELAKEIRIPINLSPTNDMKVKVYFMNNNLDPEVTCVKVFAVDRWVAVTRAIGRAAAEELLKGPTDQEKNQGYVTSINPGVKINQLTIANGTAKIDFDETLEQAVGGSCRVAAISAQIGETLKQFPAVKNVVISVNGRTEDVLQP